MAAVTAQILLEKIGVEPEEGVVSLDGKFADAAARHFCQREPA